MFVGEDPWDLGVLSKLGKREHPFMHEAPFGNVTLFIKQGSKGTYRSVMYVVIKGSDHIVLDRQCEIPMVAWKPGPQSYLGYKSFGPSPLMANRRQPPRVLRIESTNNPGMLNS